MAVLLRCPGAKESAMTRVTGLVLAAAISLPVATGAQAPPPNPLFEEPRLVDKAMDMG